MKPGRTVALVMGCLLVLPGTALLLAGAGLGSAYVLDRDQDGFVRAGPYDLRTSTAALTTGPADLVVDAGTPAWLLDRLDVDVRLDVAPGASGRPVFVGVGPASAVDTYLAGVARDEVVDGRGDAPSYRRTDGESAAGPPAQQPFWVTSASGEGTQRLAWTATEGRWVVVLMNADGSPGVAAGATVAARAGVLLPLVRLLLALGTVLTAAAVLLVVFAARGERPVPPGRPASDPDVQPLAQRGTASAADPVLLTAELDPGLSRWRWLVKWVLVVPHLLVLVVLWPVFVVLTVVAGTAVLLTGRYPRRLFDINVGVLRWSWRASYYATTGGLGTDRYPPFSLADDPRYPARFDVAYPERLSRPLVLVKWLLVLPHLLVVSLLVGPLGRFDVASEGAGLAPLGGGLLGVLVLVAGVALLLTGRYPRGLFDLVLGLNRWTYRVIAYAALMTDRYPPFRLDQGGGGPGPVPPAPAGPDVVDLAGPDRQPVLR